MKTVAHLSDLHFGSVDQTIIDPLVELLDRLAPDLIAVSGDLTQRARSREFIEARAFLDRLPKPQIIVPGNHDVPLYNVFARFLTPFAKYDHYVSPVGHSTDFFQDDEIAVLGLNTARRFTRKNGRVSIEQIAQIGRVFGNVPHKIFKILVTHHPIGMPSGETHLEMAGRSRQALEAVVHAGVNLLLSGHHHRALSGGLAEMGGGSVLVLHAGTAISTRIRGGVGNSYNLIRIVRERLTIHVMEWKAGQGFFESRAMPYVFRDRRWRPV
jgi:3',5'-cyclic AMP phosphodiesterase CpdA